MYDQIENKVKQVERLTIYHSEGEWFAEVFTADGKFRWASDEFLTDAIEKVTEKIK